MPAEATAARRPRSQDCPRGGPHAGPGSPGAGGSGAGAPADGGPGPRPDPRARRPRRRRPAGDPPPPRHLPPGPAGPRPPGPPRERGEAAGPRAGLRSEGKGGTWQDGGPTGWTPGDTAGRRGGGHRRPGPGRAAADLRRPDARSPGPRRGAATRFQPRPDRPSPQSQSFSRSYGSGLPTSLTYIVLSTRGCSPWRPAAVMGTTRGDGPRTPPHFQGPAGARRTPPETRRSTGPQPLAPDKPIPGIPPLTKKRKLFPGPRPASAGSLALQLGPPRRTEGSASGFGNIDPIPFRPGGEAPASTRRGAPASARSGTSLGLRID